MEDSTLSISSISLLPVLNMLGLRTLMSLVARVSTHMGHTTPSSTSFSSSDLLAGNLHSGHMVRSVGVMW